MTETTPAADAVATLAQEVAGYVGGVTVTPYLTDSTATAVQLVDLYIGDATVPDDARRRAVLEVAAELYHRKSAPNGVKNFADGLDGTVAVRVARDPMVAGRPILDPYLPLRFA